MLIKAFPLTWPAGWQRTPDVARAYGRFNRKEWRTSSYGTAPGAAPNRYQAKADMTVAVAVDRVLEELKRMGIDDDDLVISTNVEQRLDGRPKSGRRAPDDPGAAVYWKDRSGNTRCMAIDRYTAVEHNLAAIAATLEAMRAIERHGGAEILDRAFTGFTALPAPAAAEPWHVVFGVLAHTPTDQVREAYRRARSKAHPDAGGSASAFETVQAAWQSFCAERGVQA